MGSTNTKPSTLPQEMLRVRMSIKSSDREIAKLEKSKINTLKAAEEAYGRNDSNRARLLSAHVLRIEQHIDKIVKFKLYMESSLMTIQHNNNVNASMTTLHNLISEMERLCTAGEVVSNFSAINDKVTDFNVASNAVDVDVDVSLPHVDGKLVDDMMARVGDNVASSLSSTVPDVSLLVNQSKLNGVDSTVGVCTDNKGV